MASGAPPLEPRYLSDLQAGYETRFTAQVVALPPGGVVLSETLFYPTGGGQPADRGVLRLPDGSRVEVVDVGHQGGATLHRLGKKGASALQRGMDVVGEIDWPRRHAHMRAHTAQHLLSALAFRRFGLRTEKAQVSAKGGQLDLEKPLAGPDALKELEREANGSFFTRHVPVRLQFVTREMFDRIPNRSGTGKLPPGVDRVRLVIIGEADLAPCGGTHLSDTIEVGEVRMGPPVALPLGGVRLSFELSPEPASVSPGESGASSTPSA
ncbi:MAG: alanyl-tRNA editing protein [Euryarchaeota archaeon]|nr:alanyl-tRNA editing protein [Euryarchaeota archaeon]MDE1834982.1 alanyl-tRNA editing protein [Euryarchaeota archaeon]MDE1880677.1 alanyl-tRNA editing protein [Euryarchaeota archaeon]MDE2046567.1 alanyl-tRNA editing protein [Thermoplasmata archaeon]